MFCRPRPTQVMPAIVHPQKCCVTHSFQNVVVPHVHPSHTTHVNHTNFQHQHSFPHTESVVNEVTHQHFASQPGIAPGGFGVPRPRPGFPGY